MKNQIALLVAVAFMASSCSAYRKLSKSLGPMVTGEAPSEASVPAGFPRVKRIAIDMSSNQKRRFEEGSRKDRGSVEHAALAIESSMRKAMTSHDFEVMDRDEMERMGHEAENLPGDGPSTELDFYESLDVDAILFWDCSHGDPVTSRGSRGAVTSNADVRFDLVLKKTGRMIGDASASAAGTAIWSGSRMNKDEIIEMMSICARSGTDRLASDLRKHYRKKK